MISQDLSLVSAVIFSVMHKYSDSPLYRSMERLHFCTLPSFEVSHVHVLCFGKWWDLSHSKEANVRMDSRSANSATWFGTWIAYEKQVVLANEIWGLFITEAEASLPWLTRQCRARLMGGHWFRRRHTKQLNSLMLTKTYSSKTKTAHTLQQKQETLQKLCLLFASGFTLPLATAQHERLIHRFSFLQSLVQSTIITKMGLWSLQYHFLHLLPLPTPSPSLYFLPSWKKLNDCLPCSRDCTSF